MNEKTRKLDIKEWGWQFLIVIAASIIIRIIVYLKINPIVVYFLLILAILQLWREVSKLRNKLK